jgi:integrase
MPGKPASARKTEGVFWRPGRSGKPELWVRVVFTHPDTGKRHDLQRRVPSNKLTEAKRTRRALLDEADEIKSGARAGDAPRTFGEVLDRYEREWMKPPPMNADGSRRSRLGYKSKLSLQTHRAHLGKLREALGRLRLDQITLARLQSFRRDRLEASVVTIRKERDRITREERLISSERQRSIVTVNREMSFLRRIIRFAVASRWLTFNPFDPDTLLSVGEERPRERVLTFDEEARLLAACEAPERQHLRPLIVAAVETGMRRGELLALRWKHVDLKAGSITLTPDMTKSSRGRIVPITALLAAELLRLRKNKPHGPDDHVFADVTTFRRSFRTAMRLAGISGLRFHDLRHTTATRLVGRVTDIELQKMLGHTTARITADYVARTDEMLARASKALKEARAESVN